MPSIGYTMDKIREMEGSAAVKSALAQYLRLRYLSRDSNPALATLKTPDGAGVSEAVIEEEARDLESEAKSILKSIRAARGQEATDE